MGVWRATVAIFAAAAATSAPAQEAKDFSGWSAEHWRQAAYHDILAAYREYVESHPGVHDPANPDFAATLETARSQGLKAAQQASDRDGYAWAMAQFNRPLSDGHALVIVPSADTQQSERYWPGFVAVWRGDELRVVTKSQSDLSGARIEACDGKPIRQFLEDSLVLRAFRPREKGQWWLRPSQAFYAIGNPTPQQPRICTFRLANGNIAERSIKWQPASADDREFYRSQLYFERIPTGLTEPRPGLFLIGLQDFQPDADGRAAFAKLYSDIERRREELLKARAVVIDMRGNNGGASIWARDLSRLLWGREAFDSREENADVDWRASAANIAYLRETAAELDAQGQGEIARWFRRAMNGMEGAHGRGELFWREEAEDGQQRPSGPPLPTDFRTPVYVANWGMCASACLDANDYFKRFDNVKLIGAPTSADSTYMEVRDTALPHGPGRLVVPIKVWVGRKRGWGVIYEPDIMVTDTDWSIATFLDHVERDLAGQPAVAVRR